MMDSLFLYALKSALCLSVLYVPYQLMLRRESFYRLNRVVLLGIVVVSFVLPLAGFTLTVHETALQAAQAAGSPSTISRLVEVRQAAARLCEPDNSLFHRCAVVWLIGAVGLALLRGVALGRLVWRIRRGCLWHSLMYNATVYCHIGHTPSYSWMHSVVISEYDYEHNRREILTHELAHVDHLHSWDNLLMALCLCFQWFNPFAWMLADSLSEVHEFEADAAVLAEGVDRVGYQMLLLNKVAPASRLALANGFGHARLKTRFQMMLRRGSSRWSLLKLLLLLPMLVLAVGLLAQVRVRLAYHWATAETVQPPAAVETLQPPAEATVQSAQQAKPKTLRRRTVELPPEPQPWKPKRRVVTSPLQMAQFPGGNAALREYMHSHLPKLEQPAKVVLRLTIAKDGRISLVEVLRSGGAEADQAATRMVSSMPQWIPGRDPEGICTSTFTLPIDFDE